jgi:hypothetical protein
MIMPLRYDERDEVIGMIKTALDTFREELNKKSKPAPKVEPKEEIKPIVRHDPKPVESKFKKKEV